MNMRIAPGETLPRLSCGPVRTLVGIVMVVLTGALLSGCGGGGTTVADQTTSTLAPDLDDQFTAPDEPDVAIAFCIENTTTSPEILEDAITSLPTLVSTIGAPDREPPALDVDRPAVALSARTMTTASFGAPFWSGVLPGVRSLDTVTEELDAAGEIEVDPSGAPADLPAQRAVEIAASKDRSALGREVTDLRSGLEDPELDAATDAHEIAGCAASAAGEFADYPDAERRVIVFVSSGEVAPSQQIDQELLGRLDGVETYAVLSCDDGEIDDADVCTRAKNAFRAYAGLAGSDITFFTDGDIESAYPDALGDLAP